MMWGAVALVVVIALHLLFGRHFRRTWIPEPVAANFLYHPPLSAQEGLAEAPTACDAEALLARASDDGRSVTLGLPVRAFDQTLLVVIDRVLRMDDIDTAGVVGPDIVQTINDVLGWTEQDRALILNKLDALAVEFEAGTGTPVARPIETQVAIERLEIYPLEPGQSRYAGLWLQTSWNRYHGLQLVIRDGRPDSLTYDLGPWRDEDFDGPA